MPLQRNYLIVSSVIATDRAVLKALLDITAYAPHNVAHAIPTLIEREAALEQAEIDAERARLALDAARERLIVASRDFHDSITGAKAEVIAQFGSDSQTIHAIGLKKRSERKRPVRRRSALSA
jgi:hypothetical protein